MSTPDRADVVVIGGGTIGLSSAWRASRLGLSVVLADPEPGHGATWVAAGMLAPVTEVAYGEEALLAANLASARRWPAFAAELQAVAGTPVGYRECGTLLVAVDDGDRAWLQELYEFQRHLGLPVTWETGRLARSRVPGLAPGIRAGLWAPDDNQVDNRALIGALLTALARAGVVVVPESVAEVAVSAGRVDGVVLHGERRIAASAVVLAAGCRSGSVGGLPPGAAPAVRPVKGQILRLSPTPAAPPLPHSVRGIVEGGSVYLVPRADGSVVLGATMEEQGFDTTVTAGAVYEMLRDARRVVPGVSEMVIAEASAGLRPGSPTNGPIVGVSPDVEGLVVATGHHRNGILLTPLTAEAVAALLTGGSAPPELAPFRPGPANHREHDGAGRAGRVPVARPVEPSAGAT
ncbi:MAG TPA: glycine oxidase ThiO, partial [Acidimicrobiales bacterium]|nr:glycine oxidase ThiO [Acidimicrobiales bacterium]